MAPIKAASTPKEKDALIDAIESLREDIGMRAISMEMIIDESEDQDAAL